ncbi:MAG: hypothetical protein ACLFNR_01990 [Candidatus Paceibacterota bacterium]
MMKNFKLVTFVPESHADAVRKALGGVGAGEIGEYTHCSFSVKGVGRFLPAEGTHPYNGEVGKSSEVEEERIEVACGAEKVKEAIKAIKEVHPYEEVPIDIHPVMSEEDI